MEAAAFRKTSAKVESFAGSLAETQVFPASFAFALVDIDIDLRLFQKY